MLRAERRIAIGLTGACLGLLFACRPETPEDTYGSSQSELRIGDISRLSADEQAAYVADEQYVQGLTKPNIRIRLNLADARCRFATSRLKIAGKTPANSPHLFELMAMSSE